MTVFELQTLRIIVSITALRTLLRECFSQIASTYPNNEHRYQEIFAMLRAKQQPLTLAGIDPALLDLATHEYQKALDELLSYMESGLRSD